MKNYGKYILIGVGVFLLECLLVLLLSGAFHNDEYKDNDVSRYSGSNY